MCVTQKIYAGIHLWEWSFISGREVGATKSLKRGPKYVGLPSYLGPPKILALLRNAKLILYVTVTFSCNQFNFS